MTVRVVLCDDHAVVRSGLKLLLERRGFQVVGEADEGFQAIELCRELTPDLVVMDLTMPNGMDGLEATRLLSKEMPHLPVVVLTMHDDESLKDAILEAGARRYLLKQAPGEEMIAALYQVCQSQAPEKPRDLLTGREYEVLCRLARGYGNKEIAQQLDISVKTVETHRSHLFLKLRLETRAELVDYALKHGLMSG